MINKRALLVEVWCTCN